MRAQRVEAVVRAQRVKPVVCACVWDCGVLADDAVGVWVKREGHRFAGGYTILFGALPTWVSVASQASLGQCGRGREGEERMGATAKHNPPS